MIYFNIESNRLTYNKIAPLYAREFGLTIPDQMFFLEFLSALNGKKILDVGCGTGRYCLFALTKGYSPEGIDISEKMMSLAQSCIDKKVIKFSVQNAMDIGYQGVFDGIIACDLLCNLTFSQGKTVLSRIHDALKHDGLAYVSITEGEGEGFEPAALAPDLKIYMKRYMPKEFEELISESFDIVKVWTIDFVDPGNPGERKHYILLRKKMLNK